MNKTTVDGSLEQIDLPGSVEDSPKGSKTHHRVVYTGPEDSVMCCNIVWERNKAQDVPKEVWDVVKTHSHFKKDKD